MNAEDDDMMMDQEPFTLGLIVKLRPQEMRLINRFLTEHSIAVIYKATSYAELFISRTKHD